MMCSSFLERSNRGDINELAAIWKISNFLMKNILFIVIADKVFKPAALDGATYRIEQPYDIIALPNF